nr:hypothetical protein CFP56_31702 [Quercus suber]
MESTTASISVIISEASSGLQEIVSISRIPRRYRGSYSFSIYRSHTHKQMRWCKLAREKGNDRGQATSSPHMSTFILTNLASRWRQFPRPRTTVSIKLLSPVLCNISNLPLLQRSDGISDLPSRIRASPPSPDVCVTSNQKPVSWLLDGLIELSSFASDSPL